MNKEKKKLKNIFIFMQIYTALQLYCVDAYSFQLDSFKAAKDAQAEGLELPVADEDGGIKTNNSMGKNAPIIDSLSQEFIKDAIVPGATVLEIGTGYGLVAKEAIKQGAMYYVANDLDPIHLKVLARNIKQGLSQQALSRIKLVTGNFLHEFKGEKRFDAILIARVLHFLTPDEITSSLTLARDLLKENGAIYIIVATPYGNDDWYNDFILEFEMRKRNKDPFPGYVDDLYKVANKKVIPKETLNEFRGHHFCFFDKETINLLLNKIGFKVESIDGESSLYIKASKV
jgi:ubiquinone/menaquinone biosynthesis C-methylase UbiE